MWRHQKSRSVCVKQALNTRRWLVNALVTWHVSYKITTLWKQKTALLHIHYIYILSKKLKENLFVEVNYRTLWCNRMQKPSLVLVICILLCSLSYTLIFFRPFRTNEWSRCSIGVCNGVKFHLESNSLNTEKIDKNLCYLKEISRPNISGVDRFSNLWGEHAVIWCA